jgi:hypothetical protein
MENSDLISLLEKIQPILFIPPIVLSILLSLLSDCHSFYDVTHARRYFASNVDFQVKYP